MTIALKATMEQLEDFLKASGYFTTVSIGEPANITSGKHAAVLLGPRSVTGTTLTKTIERRDVVIRLYGNTQVHNTRELEFWMDEVQADLLTDICGDFDLGASVRNPEITAITSAMGYQTVGTVFCRICDVTVPLVVDDSATFVQ